MKIAIVTSSKTGNTARLARALRETCPAGSCLYDGAPDMAALVADRIYVGFWTDRNTCDVDTAAFLQGVHGKEIFLFGTAGGTDENGYYSKILRKVRRYIQAGNTVLGGWMCRGAMPQAVRRGFEVMAASPDTAARGEALLRCFDNALGHPDEADLAALQAMVREL